MRRFSFPSVIPVLIIGVVSWLVLMPLLGPGFIGTDDGHWMIIRFTAFYQSLAEGHFPVRFLGRLNYEYGYPVANFLYPGFMYVGSLIHAFGIDFVGTVKIILVGSVLLTSFVLYRWLRLFFRRFAAIMGTLGFLTSPYLAYDIYKRGSVGEILAFAGVAGVFYAAEAGKKTLFSVALAFLIVSHNSAAALFVPVVLVYLWVRRRIGEFLAPLALGIGLSAFFWFPALYERRYVVFDGIAVSDPSSYFVLLPSLWLLGFPGILAALAAWKSNKFEGLTHAFLSLFAATILLALPISQFVWDIRPFAVLFQFPFRFLMVGLFLGPWFIALLLDKAGSRRVMAAAVLVLAFAAQLIAARQYVNRIDLPEEFFTTNEATTTVADEYMPRWVSQKPTIRAAQRAEFYKGRGMITYRKSGLHPIDIDVQAQEDSIIQFNTLYYPGWGVVVDNTPVALDFDNPWGVMRIVVPKGNHHVMASFRETVPRFIADLVSVASGIALLAYAYAGNAAKSVKPAKKSIIISRK